MDTRQKNRPAQPPSGNRKRIRRPAGQGPQQPQQRAQQPVQQPQQWAQQPVQQPQQRAQQPPQQPVRQPRRQAPQPAPAQKKPRRRSRLTQTPSKPLAEVIYTPGKPFNKRRLLLQIGIVAAVVVAVFFSMSLFFKVDTITVSGNESYGVEAIVKASGLEKGENLLSINDAKVSGQIITKLPYVKTVRIGIKLPGTVNIEIEELEVVYSVAQSGGGWWLMTSDGRVVEKTDEAGAKERTQVLGVTLAAPEPGQQAVAQEDAPPEEPDPTGDTALDQPVTIRNAERLQTALAILQYLEKNNILGEVVSVDVTNMGYITLWYGQRFQVILGDATDMSRKISLTVAAVDQLEDHDRGTLDVTFEDRPEVVYTPRVD